jgi:protein-L-isoaspartate(D-aspartate) O-methyltransferase
MDKQTDLEIVRRAYAKQILAAAGVNDLRLQLAYASIRREDFLGPGPWQTFRGPGVYIPTPSSDPVYLYTDNLIGIVPERGINNGQPSLHAVLLSHAQIQDGEHVVHVGAGTGYYTAIIAHLVGPSGRVTAIEVDPELARQAHANLSLRQNVRVLQANGADADFGTADVIYVSAGVTHPVQAWLDGLLEAGRLILPLTTDANVRATEDGALDYAKMARRGAVFQITRFGTEFSARWILPAAYILAEGVRDKVSEAALALAFEKGDGKKVTRLYRSDDLPEDRCWLRGVGWCLAYE